MSTPDLVLRVIALCVALAGAETLHGIARTKFLNPRLGKERAVKLSVVSGSLLAFVVCLLLVPGIGLASLGAHLALGAVLALFMASFDIALGRWLLRRPWRKVAADFDPRTGNYLLFGLAVLLLIPTLVGYLRGPLA
jgi:hypothetical protein